MAQNHNADEWDRFLQSCLENAENRTVGDIFNTMSEEQKNVVYFLIGSALQEERMRIITWIEQR